MEKWCAVGGVPMTCGWMTYPAGTGPFGCAYSGCCDYQRPKCSSPPTPSPPEMPICKHCGKPVKGLEDHYELPLDTAMGLNHGYWTCQPAEMPEVEPAPGGATYVPIVWGKCRLFLEERGDKKQGTCEGCKIAGCAAKGRLKTE